MKYKTITLEDDTHIKLSKLQIQLREIGIERTLHQINDISINYGIDNTFEIIKNNEKE